MDDATLELARQEILARIAEAERQYQVSRQHDLMLSACESRGRIAGLRDALMILDGPRQGTGGGLDSPPAPPGTTGVTTATPS